MRLLSRYVGNQFIRIFLVSLLTFLAIYLIVEFFERVDDFLEKGTPLKQAVGYFVYKIPQILMQVGPAAVLLASVFCLLLLGHNNEVTAMRACGLSLYRISYPILVWGGIGSVVLFLASEYVLPGDQPEGQSDYSGLHQAEAPEMGDPKKQYLVPLR